MSEITDDMKRIKSMDLDVNGMKTIPDVKIKKSGYVEGKVKYFSYEWDKKRYVKNKTYGFRY